MLRFRLRTLMLGLVAVSVALVLCRDLVIMYLNPTRGYYGKRGMTPNGIRYEVGFKSQREFLGRHRLLHVVIGAKGFGRPSRISGSMNTQGGKNWEVYRNGVFLNGRRVGGYGDSKVVLIHAWDEYHIIPVSQADEDALAEHGMSAPIWKSKIEPEIDRLLAPPASVSVHGARSPN